jgi:hypothetical protein
MIFSQQLQNKMIISEIPKVCGLRFRVSRFSFEFLLFGLQVVLPLEASQELKNAKPQT